MNFFRKTTLFFVLIFAAMSVQAQKLQQYIPADATFVFSMNLENLDKKISFDKLNQYDFYKEMMKEVERSMSREDEKLATLMSSPSSLGIDIMSEAYAFGKMSEETSLFGFIFNISDNKKFTEFFKEMAAKEPKGVMGNMGKFKTYTTGKEGTFAWNDKFGIVVGGTANGYGEEKVARETQITTFVKSVLSSSGKNSILKNSRYTKAVGKRKSDFRMWMDYQWVIEMQMGGAQTPGMEGMMTAFKEMYKDSDYLMELNFNDGEIIMESKMFSNNKAMDQMRKMSTGKLNKRFFDYLPKDNLLGYFSFAFDTKNMADGMFEMLTPMLSESGMNRMEMEDMALSTLKDAGVELDREGLYEMISGDMVLAVTGMREFTVTKTQYDEDFNRVEVEGKQKLPEFSFMMSYGRANDVMQLMQTGIEAGALSKVNANVFKMAIPASELPMDVFIVMKDGIMFITNNDDLANGNLANGYSKGARMTKDQQKMMNDNSGLFYWDIPQTLSAFAEYATSEGMMDKMTTKMINVSKQSLQSIVARTDKNVKDSYNSEFTFNFVNKRMNGLDQLFSYFNELFLTTQNSGGM